MFSRYCKRPLYFVQNILMDLDNPSDNEIQCWVCGARISPEDHYCRVCGKGQGSFVPWYYKHWGIFVLTFFGLGPFTLFYVWKSPVISKEAKWAYAISISLITWYIVSVFYKLWSGLQNLMGGVSLY